MIHLHLDLEFPEIVSTFKSPSYQSRKCVYSGSGGVRWEVSKNIPKMEFRENRNYFATQKAERNPRQVLTISISISISYISHIISHNIYTERA